MTISRTGISDSVAKPAYPVLITLCQARDYANDTGSELWEFAVSIDQLRGLGACENELRWLIQKGFIEQRREITPCGATRRDFCRSENLCFSPRTCFVITMRGLYLIERWGFRGTQCREQSGAWPPHLAEEGYWSNPVSQPRRLGDTGAPQWDAGSRRLWWKGTLIKRFRWPAINQEAILAAFEEEHWPERVDDPLPPHREQDSKRRLADTIKCLNRKQIAPLIHFRGDGTGEGVIWEVIDNDA